MKSYKFNTSDDVILMLCAFFCLFIKAELILYVLFFFCFGLNAGKIKSSFISIVKLKPDTFSLPSLLCIVTFMTVTYSYITSNFVLSSQLSAVFLAMSVKQKHGSDKETFKFCVSVILCFFSGITALFVTNSISASLDWAYTVLCVSSVYGNTDRKYILSVLRY